MTLCTAKRPSSEALCFVAGAVEGVEEREGGAVAVVADAVAEMVVGKM